MAYFPDLSEYCYLPVAIRPNTFNVAWLDESHDFEKASAPDELIEKLWSFCRCSIGQTRGFHLCDLLSCKGRSENLGPIRASRNSSSLKLGSAEIRVFSGTKVYAAPNLIFHYVTTHNYKMPDEFVAALRSGPSPESPEYHERLNALGLRWTKTLEDVATVR